MGTSVESIVLDGVTKITLRFADDSRRGNGLSEEQEEGARVDVGKPELDGGEEDSDRKLDSGESEVPPSASNKMIE